MAGFSEFTTLLNATGPAWLGSVDEVVNDVSRATYTQPHLTTGKASEIMIQGGDVIQDMVFLEITSSFTRYNPNPTVSYTNAQPGTPLQIPWSFAYATTGWTKQEASLNRDFMTRTARAQRYKRVIKMKYQNLWTDVCNKTELEYWATPDYGTMEAANTTTPRVPYSIPVFINEWTNGLPLGFESATGGANTVETINGVTYSNWRNQTGTYADLDTAGNERALFAGFKRLRQLTQFDKLPKHADMGETQNKPHVIFMSSWGDRVFEHFMVVNQDTFWGGDRGKDVAYNDLRYWNIPLVRIDALDSALLYPNAGASAYASEATADLTGPRYYFVNGEYLVPFFHSENYASLGDPDTPSNQPFSVVQVMDMWNNLGCRSRRRQGILSPAADTTLLA